MLTKPLVQDEATASLGKTEYTVMVHISGRNLICQRVIQKVQEYNTRKLVV